MSEHRRRTNSFLANYAKQFNENIIVIPTTIDSDFHIPKPELRGAVLDSTLTPLSVTARTDRLLEN